MGTRLLLLMRFRPTAQLLTGLTFVSQPWQKRTTSVDACLHIVCSNNSIIIIFRQFPVWATGRGPAPRLIYRGHQLEAANLAGNVEGLSGTSHISASKDHLRDTLPKSSSVNAKSAGSPGTVEHNGTNGDQPTSDLIESRGSAASSEGGLELTRDGIGLEHHGQEERPQLAHPPSLPHVQRHPLLQRQATENTSPPTDLPNELHISTETCNTPLSGPPSATIINLDAPDAPIPPTSSLAADDAALFDHLTRSAGADNHEAGDDAAPVKKTHPTNSGDVDSVFVTSTATAAAAAGSPLRRSGSAEPQSVASPAALLPRARSVGDMPPEMVHVEDPRESEQDQPVVQQAFHHYRSISMVEERGAQPVPWSVPRDASGAKRSVEFEHRRQRSAHYRGSDTFDDSRPPSERDAEIQNTRGATEMSEKTPQESDAPKDAVVGKGGYFEEEEEEDAAHFWAVVGRFKWFILTFLLCIVLPGLLCGFLAPDAHVGQTSFTAWAFILGIIILAWPVVYLIVHVAGWTMVYLAMYRKKGPAMMRYYVEGLRVPVTTFAWAIAATVLFHVLIVSDPFPPARPPGYRRNVMDQVWWIERFFICGIIVSILPMGRAYMIRRVALQRRAEGYHERVREAIMSSMIMSHLTKNVSPKMIAPRVKAQVKRRKRAVEFALASKSAPSTPPDPEKGRKQFRMWKSKATSSAGPGKSTKAILKQAASALSVSQNRQETESTASQRVDHVEDHVNIFGNPNALNSRKFPRSTNSEIDMDKLLADADTVQRMPMMVCRRTKQIRSIKDARYLGSALFDWYSGVRDLRTEIINLPDATIRVSTLLDQFPPESKLRSHAERILDPSKTGKLTREQLMTCVVEVFLGRKNLAHSLGDLDSIIHAINAFLINVQAVLTFLVVLVGFSTGELADIALTAGTTILGLSFIFSDTCKHVFQSFVLLFVRAPFDAGDRVEIQGYSEPLYVQKMELHYTVFTVWNGLVVTIPNHDLYNKTIFNVHRSGMMWEQTKFSVSVRTSSEKLRLLEERWRETLRAHPFDFHDARSFFLLDRIEDANKLVIHMISAQRTNWQNGEHVIRRNIITAAMRKACEDLGIEYGPPIQRVNLVGNGVPPPSSTFESGSSNFATRAASYDGGLSEQMHQS
ncbi:uncharacterized protein MONBRDRAFT_31864 [Monosiga brevicollis MX1]|uniref:EF-hand domain-containing protein n=1 Tax=Monosiga brevicollis TaxID=81824 RepID=A9UVW0_MONBE|nr:uncharacterized protein MONBRDRAFT_31864 [Monosiga brevicollis MX1]EDQ90459.1 predicted protein [Monosiga brevicollis MX1]|eukprot:XP_001744510.1 hypothetical protein [Monosiga brevicollis MX1]